MSPRSVEEDECEALASGAFWYSARPAAETDPLHYSASVSVSIPSVRERVDESDGAVIFYDVCVSVGASSWCTPRRYREFRSLSAALSNLQWPGDVAPPELPKKWAGSTAPAFIASRRRALETYARAVLAAWTNNKNSAQSHHTHVTTATMSDSGGGGGGKVVPRALPAALVAFFDNVRPKAVGGCGPFAEHALRTELSAALAEAAAAAAVAVAVAVVTAAAVATATVTAADTDTAACPPASPRLVTAVGAATSTAFLALEDLMREQCAATSASRVVAQAVAHALFDALGVRSTLLTRGAGVAAGAALGTISALTAPGVQWLRSAALATEAMSGFELAESALHWPQPPDAPYLHLIVRVRGGSVVHVRSASPRALAFAALAAAADHAPGLQPGSFTAALDALIAICSPERGSLEPPLDEGTAFTLLLVVVSQPGAGVATAAATVAAALTLAFARAATAAAPLELSVAVPAPALANILHFDVLRRARALAAKRARSAPAPALCTGFAAAALAATERESGSGSGGNGGADDDTFDAREDSGGGVCDVLRPGRCVRGAAAALLRGFARLTAAEAAADVAAARTAIGVGVGLGLGVGVGVGAGNTKHSNEAIELSFLQPGAISAIAALSLSEALLAPVVPAAALIAILHEAIAPRGALPVGELGKRLRAALVPRALADFKDRAGGLKRFIDARTDEFSVATDHPFNPLVSRVGGPCWLGGGGREPKATHLLH